MENKNLIATIIVVLILSGISLLFIIGNGMIFYKGWIKKEECPSVMPFLGGIFGAIAVLLVFGLEYWFLALIPLMLDWGCIPAIIRLIYFLIKYPDRFRK